MFSGISVPTYACFFWIVLTGKYSYSQSIVKLPTLLEGLPNDKKEINVLYKNLHTIDYYVFKRFTKCEVISLYVNQIRIINVHAFFGLINLRWLNLDDNYISNLAVGTFNNSLLLKFSLKQNFISTNWNISWVKVSKIFNTKK